MDNKPFSRDHENDLISRQQAIDALENTKTAISENGERYIAKQNAIMRIDALPSAQPTFDARDTQYNLPIGTDLISRQAAIYIASGYCHPANIAKELAKLPSVEPQIIYCKDCRKHNKRIGGYVEKSDGTYDWIWKDQACPLAEFRGKAQGHEFDYQFCAYGERRTE